MDRPIKERNKKTTSNQRIFKRDLFLWDQKRNL